MQIYATACEGNERSIHLFIHPGNIVVRFILWRYSYCRFGHISCKMSVKTNYVINKKHVVLYDSVSRRIKQINQLNFLTLWFFIVSDRNMCKNSCQQCYYKYTDWPVVTIRAATVSFTWAISFSDCCRQCECDSEINKWINEDRSIDFRFQLVTKMLLLRIECPI